MRLTKRSWGWYFVLLDYRHFKIKLLRFRKDAKLSIQYHNHRSELWLFLSGAGKFRLNEYIDSKLPGDYVLTKPEDVHTFYANKVTYAIEVQFGDRCVEEDIVRL